MKAAEPTVKIVADVKPEVKEMLQAIARFGDESMKDALERMIVDEYKNIPIVE